MSEPASGSRKLALWAAELAAEKKAEDLALLEKCSSRLREGGRITIPQGKDFIEMK